MAITEKQQLALDGLLGGDTMLQAAKKAGVSRQLVGRWCKTIPDFREALRDQRETGLEELRQQITALVPTAINAVRHCLTSANVTVRIRAADIVLTKAQELTEATSMQAEIDELKDEINRLQAGDTGQAEGPGEAAGEPLPGPAAGSPRPVVRPPQPDAGRRTAAG